MIDTKLVMRDVIRSATGKVRGKLKALLRTMSVYNLHAIMNQYKCHILPLLESITPAVYHASATTLALLDDAAFIFEKHRIDRRHRFHKVRARTVAAAEA